MDLLRSAYFIFIVSFLAFRWQGSIRRSSLHRRRGIHAKNSNPLLRFELVFRRYEIRATALVTVTISVYFLSVEACYL